jgi:site-specific DNA-methyltransferase (adenine-specific)
MNQVSPFLDLRLGDCMDLMREYPDGHFDLAIVDPPYGIGCDGKGMSGRASNSKKFKGFTGSKYLGGEWDKEPPPVEYFNEVRRVSKNQIVWGANHFISKIPIDSPCWIAWDKKQNPNDNAADCELALTSFKTAVRLVRIPWSGFGHINLNETRIHPTQKPRKLYDWLLANYAKPGDRILDTHLGSGSIAIACHYREHHLTACEIDPDYYAAALDRIERETRQLTLF